jgi:hypothetical protein
VSHFFDHDARDSAAVPVSGRVFQQIALLLDAGKFCIALVDDHIHQRIAHLLRGNLAQVLPLAAALIGTEFNLFSIDRTVERVEVERLDVLGIDADIFAPVVEHAFPVAERSDFRYFAGHKIFPQSLLRITGG